MNTVGIKTVILKGEWILMSLKIKRYVTRVDRSKAEVIFNDGKRKCFLLLKYCVPRQLCHHSCANAFTSNEACFRNVFVRWLFMCIYEMCITQTPMIWQAYIKNLFKNVKTSIKCIDMKYKILRHLNLQKNYIYLGETIHTLYWIK